MSTSKMNRTRWAIGAAGLLALTACGGGGGGGSANNGNGAPSLTTAATSVEGLQAYMKVAVTSSSETSEPIDVSTFVAPTSDTTEPDPSI